MSDTPPPPVLREYTAEETAALDAEFLKWGWEGKTRSEAEWRAQGYAVAWVDLEPTWIGCCHWFVYVFECEDPKHPCVRIIRFALLGGGQIRVQEKFVPNTRQYFPEQATEQDYQYGTRLLIKAETPAGIVQVSGRIDSTLSDMPMSAVVVAARHQAIADRAAATLRLIGAGHPKGYPDKDNFTALLDGSSGCAFCGRRLRDVVSKTIGFGPECAPMHRLAHNTAAANVVLARRRELFAKNPITGDGS